VITSVDVIGVQDLSGAGIYAPGFFHTLVVQVSVDVNTKSTQAGFVDGDMAQDHAIHHMVSTEFAEVLTILIVPEDVVIATDENFVTVEPGESL
jgi:enhancing lycopene biosynthesis protein 2